MNNKLEPFTRCADRIAKEESREINSGFGTLKAGKAAATIGLAISVSTAGVLLDSSKEVIAGEVISSNPSLAKLSKKNNRVNSSVTPTKLTVKSSADRITPQANTTPALIHQIKPGETLATIATEYDLAPEKLAIYNDLAADKELAAGQMLKIPVNEINSSKSERGDRLKNLKSKQLGLKKSLAKLPSHQSPTKEAVKGKIIYKVQAGDTLGKIAARHGVSITQLIRENKITDPNSIEVDLELVITPASKETAASTGNRYVSRPEKAENSQLPVVSQQKARQLEPTASEGVNPYVAKLRADIQKLQQEYQTPSSATTAKVTARAEEPRSPEASISVSERLSTPQWIEERLERQSKRKTNSLPLTSQSQTNTSLPLLDSLRSSRRRGDLDRAKPQLINSLNTNPENSNNYYLGISPISDRISPELPALSTDEYLPVALNSRVASFRGYQWPTDGRITSGFGWRWGRLHKGVDIAGPVGTPIFSAAPGRVIYAGWNSGGYGNLVKLRHYDGSVTLYAHNSSILVRRGQTVGQGQMIARMGSTGYSTGPHLHFEIHRSRGAVNPMAYLPRKRR